MSTIESRRTYYIKNRSTIIERSRVWQLNNPELVKLYKTKSRRKVRANKPYMTSIYEAKSRSIKNGIEFDLTESWARNRWTGKCELTGADFDLLGDGKPSAFSISLDRIDPMKGYTEGNCRFILWAINRFKSNYDDATMMRIARLLVGGH